MKLRIFENYNDKDIEFGKVNEDAVYKVISSSVVRDKLNEYRDKYYGNGTYVEQFEGEKIYHNITDVRCSIDDVWTDVLGNPGIWDIICHVNIQWDYDENTDTVGTQEAFSFYYDPTTDTIVDEEDIHTMEQDLVPLTDDSLDKTESYKRKNIKESNQQFDTEFLKYYNQMSLEDIADELGSDFDADMEMFQELEDNGYGTAVSGLLAKPEYEDALWDDSIGCLTIMDNGTIGYNYGGYATKPMYFNSVFINEVEDCLRDHGLLDEEFDEEDEDFDESFNSREHNLNESPYPKGSTGDLAHRIVQALGVEEPYGESTDELIAELEEFFGIDFGFSEEDRFLEWDEVSDEIFSQLADQPKKKLLKYAKILDDYGYQV